MHRDWDGYDDYAWEEAQYQAEEWRRLEEEQQAEIIERAKAFADETGNYFAMFPRM